MCRQVYTALADGDMDADDKALLLDICPKATIAQPTEWHPKNGGRGSEKLEAGLRRERASGELGGGGPSGGQPVADDAVVIDEVGMTLHRMVTEDPEVSKAAQKAAQAAARVAAAEAAVVEKAEKVAARAAALEKLGKDPEDAPEEEEEEAPIQCVNEKSAEELQTEMEEKMKAVFECWGNLDPRTHSAVRSR